MNSQRGQSLFEVVIALAIVGITATGIVKISTLSIKNARFASEQSGAVALGEKKVAEVKAQAINDYQRFWTVLNPVEGFEGPYCYLIEKTDLSSDPVNYLPTDTPNYTRAGLMKVKITVFWEAKMDVPTCDKTGYRSSIELATQITK